MMTLGSITRVRGSRHALLAPDRLAAYASGVGGTENIAWTPHALPTAEGQR